MFIRSDFEQNERICQKYEIIFNFLILSLIKFIFIYFIYKVLYDVKNVKNI